MWHFVEFVPRCETSPRTLVWETCMRQNVPNYFHCLLSVRLYAAALDAAYKKGSKYFLEARKISTHISAITYFLGKCRTSGKRDWLRSARDMIYGRWICGDISGFGGVKYWQRKREGYENRVIALTYMFLRCATMFKDLHCISLVGKQQEVGGEGGLIEIFSGFDGSARGFLRYKKGETKPSPPLNCPPPPADHRLPMSLVEISPIIAPWFFWVGHSEDSTYFVRT